MAITSSPTRFDQSIQFGRFNADVVSFGPQWCGFDEGGNGDLGFILRFGGCRLIKLGGGCIVVCTALDGIGFGSGQDIGCFPASQLRRQRFIAPLGQPRALFGKFGPASDEG